MNKYNIYILLLPNLRDKNGNFVQPFLFSHVLIWDVYKRTSHYKSVSALQDGMFKFKIRFVCGPPPSTWDILSFQTSEGENKNNFVKFSSLHRHLMVLVFYCAYQKRHFQIFYTMYRSWAAISNFIFLIRSAKNSEYRIPKTSKNCILYKEVVYEKI